MSLEIAYAAMGGDLETVRGRLLTDERIEKFAKIFLQDTSMRDAGSALRSSEDPPEAYRGAHTLKGVRVAETRASVRGRTPLPRDALRLESAPACRPTWKRFPSSCPAVRDAYQPRPSSAIATRLIAGAQQPND
ncbi:MAG: hypothetical protein ACLTSX_12885 [Collinsella sp.]